MNIVVYTKPDCSYCLKAKSLLALKNVTYTESVVGYDITKADFMMRYPGVKSVPHVVVDGNSIGGYDKLNEWLSTSYTNFLAG